MRRGKALLWCLTVELLLFLSSLGMKLMSQLKRRVASTSYQLPGRGAFSGDILDPTQIFSHYLISA